MLVRLGQRLGMVMSRVMVVVGHQRILGKVELHHRSVDLCRHGEVSGMDRRRQQHHVADLQDHVDHKR